MILEGQFLGYDSTPYDFTASDGKHLVGESNNAYLLVPRDQVLLVRDRFKKIKLEKGYVPASKVDAQVKWSVDLQGKGMVLVNEAGK